MKHVKKSQNIFKTILKRVYWHLAFKTWLKYQQLFDGLTIIVMENAVELQTFWSFFFVRHLDYWTIEYYQYAGLPKMISAL